MLTAEEKEKRKEAKKNVIKANERKKNRNKGTE